MIQSSSRISFWPTNPPKKRNVSPNPSLVCSPVHAHYPSRGGPICIDKKRPERRFAHGSTEASEELSSSSSESSWRGPGEVDSREGLTMGGDVLESGSTE